MNPNKTYKGKLIKEAINTYSIYKHFMAAMPSVLEQAKHKPEVRAIRTALGLKDRAVDFLSKPNVASPSRFSRTDYRL